MREIVDTNSIPRRYQAIADSDQNQIPSSEKGECKDTVILIPDMQIPNGERADLPETICSNLERAKGSIHSCYEKFERYHVILKVPESNLDDEECWPSCWSSFKSWLNGFEKDKENVEVKYD